MIVITFSDIECIFCAIWPWDHLSDPGIIKTTSSTHQISRDCQELYTADPCTNPVGGLLVSLLSFRRGGTVGNVGAISHAQETRFLRMTLATLHVAGEKRSLKRSASLAGKVSAQSKKVLYFQAWYAWGTVLRGYMQMPFMQSCHSTSVKWITLKAREKFLLHLSNSSSPKPSVYQ